MLFGILNGFAQETYKVISKSNYNIRTAPNTDSEIIGSTNNRSFIDVYEIKDGWAKIKHGNDTAFVKSDCLAKMSEINEQSKVPSINETMEESKWIIFVCFCISVFLVIVIVKRSHSEFLSDFLYNANLIAFNLLCFLEWLYILRVGEYFLWYFNPAVVGVMVILNALFFGFIAISQTLAFYYTMEDFKDRYDANFHLHVGIWSLPGLVVFSILAGSLWGLEAVFVVFLVFFLCQIFQVVSIFVKMLQKSNWLLSLIASYTYIVGYVTTLMVASILFFVIVLFFIMRIMINALGASGNQRHYYDY